MSNDKNEIFNNFLKNFNIDFFQLNNIVKESPILNEMSSCTIYYYISHFEQLGHSNSDVDVYVYFNDECLAKKISDFEENGVKLLQEKINGLNLDIEIREEKFLIEQMDYISKMTRSYFTKDEQILKSYVRLKNSLTLSNNELTKLVDLTSTIDPIESIVAEYYFYYAREKFDDGKKLSSSNEHIIANECFRASVILMAGAINSINGKICIKQKWIHKIFLNLDLVDFQDENAKKDYEDLIIYPTISENNLIIYQRKLINLYQMLVCEMSFKI